MMLCYIVLFIWLDCKIDNFLELMVYVIGFKVSKLIFYMNVFMLRSIMYYGWGLFIWFNMKS